jgi:TnpA family transposase
VPDEAEALMQQAYSLLPHLKITELLLEVDGWTGFSRHFKHLKSGAAAEDQHLLLTTILADAINLGLSKMAESCPGVTYAKLTWLQAWHIRDETYSAGLAELVNAQFRQPFAAYWGDGTTSSSDGQNFKAGGRGHAAGQVNLKYGQEPGVQFYTHISDQYAPFHTKVINATVRDATHVLDGLLHHESDLRIEEHYTDTAGFTDHLFALMHLLGFRFAPRIRDLADKRLYIHGDAKQYPTLAGLIGGSVNVKQIRAHWDEILRLAASIKQGTVTASLMLRKLGSYPRQNGLAVALRELGRIERTLFALDWMQNVELRRRVQVTVDQPEGIIKEVVYPVVSKKTLEELVAEFKTMGFDFEREVQESMRSSYGHHYRSMLMPVLDALIFQSNNTVHRPVIEALAVLKANRDSRQQYYNAADVPLEGIVSTKLRDVVVEQDKNGKDRVNRINYEICVLRALRKRLRTKEIWVDGADRYRNPEQDLPADFADKRDSYYAMLDVPKDVAVFIEQIQSTLRQGLKTLNDGLPDNPKVRLRQQGKNLIHLSPLEAQTEPPNTAALKREIGQRWSDVELIDIVKEVDLRVNFTAAFRTTASREALDPALLQRRLLLCLFGIGTNVGLKRVASQQPSVNFEELRYVKRRFVQKEALRAAIGEVVNGIFQIRNPAIWGSATTACAADSKKFGAYDQNLMTEWHARYGGRGVMIYWHVDTNSTCIYSQLRRCSSSEVAAMMEGVLRHCTDMEIERQYVDSHGQSEVAFAFSYILGFDLLPRLKAIARQKLSLAASTDAAQYPNLEPILTRAINWELIRQQYDEIIKYTTALKLGTAEPEAILRRFTRAGAAHPTYKALTELGKAIKTIFLCRYLHEESLRREIHEGLNVVENWNSANNFIFYGERGEFATNRVADQELAVLSLHLLQVCLVYVNTLFIQEVLTEPAWRDRMTVDDWRGLTPLIYHHVNPYGRIELDMVAGWPTRLDHAEGPVA